MKTGRTWLPWWCETPDLSISTRRFPRRCLRSSYAAGVRHPLTIVRQQSSYLLHQPGGICMTFKYLILQIMNSMCHVRNHNGCFLLCYLHVLLLSEVGLLLT
jgi:hypothetical protein